MKRLQSIYFKWIVFGCALTIIPLAALGLFSYMNSAKSIQKQVNQSSVQLMKQVNGNMEQVLRTLDHTLTYVINTNLVQESLDRPLTYNEFQQYNALRRELGHLQTFDTKVTDVILLNTSHNWFINNRGLYPLNEVPQRDRLTSLIRTLPLSTSWVLHQTGEFGASEAESYRCKYSLTLVKKMPMHTLEKRGLAMATIPACSLASMLDQGVKTSSTMVLDAGNQILLHADENMVGKSVTETGWITDRQLTALQRGSGQFETTSGGETMSVTFVRSTYNDWTYVSFTAIGQVTKEARAIGWFTLYVCLAIIALSVAAVWLGSRRMYNPIGSIMNAISERLPNQTDKKKDEFSVIREHIQDMFLSNSHLKQEVRQNSQQVRSLFLMKLYQGNAGRAETTEKLAQYGYDRLFADWKQAVVLNLRVDALDETRYEAKDMELLLFAINNILEEMIPAERRLHPIVIDQTQVTTVGASDLTETEFHDYVYTLTEEIQGNIRKFLDLEVSIGISLPFREASKAARAYQEGMEALKQRLVLGKGVIVPYSSLNSGKHTVIFSFPRQLENELIDAIKLADDQTSLELLTKWIGEVFQKERQPHEYQVALIRLLNDLLVVMQESGIRLEQLSLREGSIYEQLLGLYMKQEIEAWFATRIVLPMAAIFRDRQASQYQNLSEQMIDMIQNEFDTDLTLEQCA
ncbi:cache domain-containing protein, partial [Cohnella sp.]|uniref:cache domain-containing protein n=1 Tax=Cohnella sp. TaxID=1883426 RepID=UPI003569DC2B